MGIYVFRLEQFAKPLLDIELAVAVFGLIPVAAAKDLAAMSGSTVDLITLPHAGEGRTDIFQLIVNIQGDFAQSHDQPQHSNRGDQNQFRRNNKSSFVVQQVVQASVHRLIHCLGER